jgi:hypothetical protein
MLLPRGSATPVLVAPDPHRAGVRRRAGHRVDSVERGRLGLADGGISGHGPSTRPPQSHTSHSGCCNTDQRPGECHGETSRPTKQHLRPVLELYRWQYGRSAGAGPRADLTRWWLVSRRRRSCRRSHCSLASKASYARFSRKLTTVSRSRMMSKISPRQGTFGRA